ncbi:hypothetical protein ACFO5R_08775 [Halosolutus amylolyticus]|uniref:Uncharacterized protein n=1 Tax=Halosolutus amylolyticus TaxID=2932267 RepID=A0ABD5PNM2_9EURY|nr:hypothetical protein [Halosolutus amylolyticus]
MAQEGNETTNETDTAEDLEFIRSIMERHDDPADAPDQYVEIVRNWADENMHDLDREDRTDISSWLRVAESGGDRDDDPGDDELGNTTKVNLSKADTLAENETIRFSDSARILGWEFRDGAARVAIQTDIRTSVTMTDALAGLEDEGAVHVPKTSQELEEGTHIVTLPVETVQQGSAVGVTANGATVRLSSGMMAGSNPLRYFGGTSGLFAGMVLSIAMSGAAALFVVWREDNGVMKA